jgi:DNA-binding HxlR family transcriptional regulator
MHRAPDLVGYRRFTELAGFTGASRDVLSARLRKLEAIAGCTHPVRGEPW